jgi:DNA-binding transcriptional MerR regulator
MERAGTYDSEARKASGMSKSPEAFRTISEVAEQLDLPAHVLRFWETRFAQVKPVKRGGGRRYYRPDDVRLLRGIRGLLYDDGMTIKGVQKILREQGVRHVIGLGTVEEPAAPAPPPVPAKTRRPAAAPAPLREPALAVAEGPAEGEAPRPQADLFDAAEVAAAVGEEGNAKPIDRDALRRLVAELEALRERMISGPGAR